MGGPEMIPPITRHASRWQYMIHAAPSGGRWKAVAVAVGFVSIAGHAPLLLKESREGPRGPFHGLCPYPASGEASVRGSNLARMVPAAPESYGIGPPFNISHFAMMRWFFCPMGIRHALGHKYPSEEQGSGAQGSSDHH